MGRFWGATPMIISLGNLDRALYNNDADGELTTYQVKGFMQGSTDGYQISTAAGMAAGTWHHVVGTYEGGSGGAAGGGG